MFYINSIKDSIILFTSLKDSYNKVQMIRLNIWTMILPNDWCFTEYLLSFVEHRLFRPPNIKGHGKVHGKNIYAKYRLERRLACRGQHITHECIIPDGLQVMFTPYILVNCRQFWILEFCRLGSIPCPFLGIFWYTQSFNKLFITFEVSSIPKPLIIYVDKGCFQTSQVWKFDKKTI